MKMQLYKLNQLLLDMHSGGTPDTSNPEYWNGNFKWLSSGETRQRFIENTESRITQLGIEKSSTKLAKKNDVVMACAGQGKTRGQVSFLLDDMYINQSVIAMTTDEKILHPLYLFYNLSGRYNELRGSSDASSTRGSITTKSLKKLAMLIPNMESQKNITDILIAYDNLIENNNKRIRLLEQMAENLYKEWFVRFRFPGYEDTEFEDGMPRDWVREKIGLHYNTCSGGTPSRTHEEYYTEGTIPWVKTGEIKDGIIIHTDECITEAGIKGSSAKLLPQGAVVMAMYGVNIGMLAYLDSEMTCNQACCVFNDKNEINSRHYLFHYLYSIRDYLLLIGFGAAQQNLSQDLIKKVKIVIPPAELIKELDKQKEPLYQTIRALMMQNDKLIKQRDALLPRLMSGKLEV